jgi:hypothetical protein
MTLRSASVLALTALSFGVACARQPKIIDIKPVTAIGPQALVGTLDMVVGDPQPSGGPERLSTFLVEAGGKRTPLVIARGQIDALGPSARQPGVRVRVVGEPVTYNGSAAFRVVSISLSP